MKQNYKLRQLLKVCCQILFAIGLMAVLTLTSRAQETNASPYKTSFDDIIASPYNQPRLF
jgi:hypothetical protein